MGHQSVYKDVAVVDLASRRRTGSIAMEGDPLGAVLSPDSRTLYVTTISIGCLFVRSADNGGRIVRSTPVPQACTELAIHPTGNRLYVPTWKAGNILELDARSLSVTRRYEVGRQPLGVALSTDACVSTVATNTAGSIWCICPPGKS